MGVSFLGDSAKLRFPAWSSPFFPPKRGTSQKKEKRKATSRMDPSLALWRKARGRRAPEETLGGGAAAPLRRSKAAGQLHSLRKLQLALGLTEAGRGFFVLFWFCGGGGLINSWPVFPGRFFVPFFPTLPRFFFF